MAWSRLRASIPALEGRVYLNSGMTGPQPARVIEEELSWVRQLAEKDPGRPDTLNAFFDHVEHIRAIVAGFLGANADEIALTQSCSEGIALVAAGLSWQPGDEVIVSDLEHMSGLLPWFDLQRRFGVEVRSVPLRDGCLHVDDVAAAVSPNTKLICMSHVAYNTGARLPVEDVATLARERGALLLVDGAQGAGQFDFSVKQLGCHFYACPGQKWVLGPEGTGALYIEAESLERVAPRLLGWASVVNDGAPPEQFKFKPGAARYEVSGKHLPSLAGLATALDILAGVGLNLIEGRIKNLVGYARDGLGGVPGLHFVTPTDANARSGLLVFRFDAMGSDDVLQALWDKHRIVCRTIPQFNAVRISVHAFNTFDELDLLVSALKELAAA